MKVIFSDDLIQYLNEHSKKKDNFVLDLDDGVGMFSKQGQCSLDLKFNFLIVDTNYDLSNDYPIEVSSNYRDVYIKESSSKYFDSDVRLKLNGSSISMSNDSQLIDNHVQIKKEE